MEITPKVIEKLLITLNKYRLISVDHKKNDCYGWSGETKSHNNPRIAINGSSIGAHRAAWMVHNGKIPPFMYVRHSCQNPECTNPKHLYLSKDKGNRKKPEDRKNNRPGRERLTVDLPERLVEDIRNMANKHNQTITKYVFKRMCEVIAYEKSIDRIK